MSSFLLLLNHTFMVFESCFVFVWWWCYAYYKCFFFCDSWVLFWFVWKWDGSVAIFAFFMLLCCSISMLSWDLVGGFLLSTCFEAKLTMDLLLSEWLNYSHAEGWSFIIKSPTFACLWLDLVSYKLLYRVCFISVITFVFYIDLSPSLNTISCLLM